MANGGLRLRVLRKNTNVVCGSPKVRAADSQRLYLSLPKVVEAAADRVVTLLLRLLAGTAPPLAESLAAVPATFAAAKSTPAVAVVTASVAPVVATAYKKQANPFRSSFGSA